MLSLTIKQQFPVPVTRLYRAFTESKDMMRWFCPDYCELTEGNLDVREQGEYRIAMRSPEQDFILTGRYRTVEPNQRLVFTWRWEPHEQDMLVEVLFAPLSEGGSELPD